MIRLSKQQIRIKCGISNGKCQINFELLQRGPTRKRKAHCEPFSIRLVKLIKQKKLLFCVKIEKDNRLEVSNLLQVTPEPNVREVGKYFKYNDTSFTLFAHYWINYKSVIGIRRPLVHWKEKYDFIYSFIYYFFFYC